MDMGYLWLSAAAAFAALMVAAVWFIRRDAINGVRLETAKQDIAAMQQREALHEKLSDLDRAELERAAADWVRKTK